MSREILSMRKLAGVLPKNNPMPYKEPERPKRVEIEQAHDGSYIISCYGGKGEDSYMGKKHTAKDAHEAAEKMHSFFTGKKSEKKDD